MYAKNQKRKKSENLTVHISCLLPQMRTHVGGTVFFSVQHCDSDSEIMLMFDDDCV